VIGSSLHSFCSIHSHLCRSCITEWRHGREGVTLWQKLVRNDLYAMRCCEPAVYGVCRRLAIAMARPLVAPQPINFIGFVVLIAALFWFVNR
jgi:hypothetical protein